MSWLREEEIQGDDGRSTLFLYLEEGRIAVTSDSGDYPGEDSTVGLTLEQACKARDVLDGMIAELQEKAEKAPVTRTEWRGYGHPAWPDPLLFIDEDDARRWYTEYVDQHPNISVGKLTITAERVLP
jgi:hypothetical protein